MEKRKGGHKILRRSIEYLEELEIVLLKAPMYHQIGENFSPSNLSIFTQYQALDLLSRHAASAPNSRFVLLNTSSDVIIYHVGQVGNINTMINKTVCCHKDVASVCFEDL